MKFGSYTELSSGNHNIDKIYKFELENKEIVTSYIINEKSCDLFFHEDFLKDENTEVILLSNLANESMFRLFERFINEDDITDISGINFDYFNRFYSVSNFLQLKDTALVRFAKNLTKIGLFGSYYMYVVTNLSKLFSEEISNTTWAIFLAFLEKIGCRIKYKENDGSVDIESMDQSDSVNQYSIEDYKSKTNISKLNIMYLDLDLKISYIDWFYFIIYNGIINTLFYNSCGIKSNNTMKIFIWFIYQLKFTKLEFGNNFIIALEFMNAFTDALLYIQNGMAEKNSIKLDSLDISKKEISFKIFEPVLGLINKTENITKLYANISDMPYNCASSFSRLEVLHLEGVKADTEFFKTLLREQCNLKELKISIKSLDSNLILDFKKLINLESLTLTGKQLNSKDLQELLLCIPSIRVLSLETYELDVATAKAFKFCKNLESLNLSWDFQQSSFVKDLLLRIPSIKFLCLKTYELGVTTAKDFKNCKNLESLILLGKLQDSNFLKTLLPCISSIRVLSLETYKLNIATAEAFVHCKNLESLTLSGKKQNSNFVKILLPCIPFIKVLSLEVNKLDIDITENFKHCKNLKSLTLLGKPQDSSFVKNLLPSIPLIRVLSLSVWWLDPESALAFKSCTYITKLTLFGYGYDEFWYNLEHSIPSDVELNIRYK